jgi:hypothetical protein
LASEKEIVLAYQQAHNAHDVDLVLSYMTPNIRYMMTGLWTREGLDELRALESWDAALNSHLTYGELKVRQGRMDCRGSETNDWYKLVGIGQVEFDSIKFEFMGDKIAHIRSRISPKSERAVDQAMNDVVRWALDVDPDEVHALVPRGTFKYGTDHASRWMALVRKWKASQE